MQAITREQLIASFQDLGIQSGDGLLVHSAIQYLGRPAGGVGLYLEAIRAVIGPQGTLAVPAFNFDFTRGVPFDPLHTPSQGMGVFSEYIRQQPEALRTPHPMQSLAVIGRYAGDLARCDTPSAFDPGSPFERMLELDFKLLLLGADILYVAMVHYSEQRANVPYRYWKDFHGQVHTSAGWETRTYRMFVRDLDLDPHLVLSPIQDLLQSRSQWASERLNYGQIAACRLADFVAAADDLLAADPWALVSNRPV
jgi:aminoglycoside 3-N-acetyltransferase